MGRFFLLIPLLASKGTAGSSCGPIANQIFHCPKFGFTVRVPFGWVDRTSDMAGKPESGSEGSVRQGRVGSGSQVLLAVFDHPPEVRSDKVNSAVVVAAERQRDYPEIKSAADYLGPITDLAEQRGFRVAGEPHPVLVDGRQLIRGDFSREEGKLTLWQSTLVVIENHSILSFTFIGASQEEAEELISQLNFSPPQTK